MRITNHTPFPMLCYEGRGIHDAPFDTVVVRVTLDLAHHRVLRLAQEQTPLAFKDEYVGEPVASSVRTESDLAPAKPTADILVVGTARAPGGVACPAWPVSVTVGAVEKHLRVTGPRAWVRGPRGYTLTDPEPCAEVPLRYELAFGGVANRDDREVAYEPNPLGVGFVPALADERRERIEAPRIEDPRDPVTELGASHRPEGFGVWGRTWAPRLQRAGTYDEAWRRERWPLLPLDFDFAYWNCAHPDLIAPALLRGDEAVALAGFHPEGERRFHLPGHEVFLLLERTEGEGESHTLPLDTLVIDVDRAKVVMVYRRVLPWPRPESLELRMVFRDPAETEGRLGVPDGR
jgi:hypothetical protein